MPLTAKGKKLKKKFKEQYGKKKGESVFYAMENSGKLKGVVKAYVGKAIKQPTETKKEFKMRHAYHTPFMKKPKGFRGGGMDASKSDFKTPSARSVGRDPSKQFEDKASISQVSRDALTAQRKTSRYTLSPSVSPAGRAISFAAGLIIPGGGLIASKLMDRTPYWKRDQIKPVTAPPERGDGSNKVEQKQKIILPIETTKPVDIDLVKPSENFFDFKAYKVGGLSGGVRYGTPPKKGPNSQVPPVKMKKGGYKK